MLAKLSLPFVLLCGALVLACGDSGSGSSNGGSGGSGGSTGGSGGSTGGSTATAGSGGTGGTGGMTSTGGTTSSGGTGGTTNPGCSGLGDACTDCLADKCNATYCACYADPACGSLVQCAQACAGNADCNQNCFTNNENGISEAALLNNCAATQCPSCPGTASLSPCELCVFTSCAPQMNTCLANPDCNALLACAQACPMDANYDTCVQNCGFANFGGIDDAQNVSSCVSANCSNSGC
jgi:hypothetical protein